MPIPYRDQDDLDTLGAAAFLRLESIIEPVGYRGALFQINARGEPVEFTYNRVETPSTFLWRPADIRRAASRRLTTSLLTLCPRVPRLILCLAAETPAELFSQDIAIAIPVCRIAQAMDAAPAVREADEITSGEEPLHLFWHPAQPGPETPERALADRLILHGLLLEPFKRASVGLDELFGEADPTQS